MDAIRIENLKFKWPDANDILLDIDHLNLEKNTSLFIQGKSGSGKSTLLSLLAGILTPNSGNIKILGQNLNDLKSKNRDVFRAHHIGYIFQMFNLLPYLNVIENVILPCRFSRLRAEKIGSSEKDVEIEARRLLKSVGLSDHEILNKRPTELSLGQQQRVAACRALIGSPEILIADEPTSALDAHSQIDFLKLLLEECSKNKATLIFVSHDDRLASNFTKVAHLDNGKMTFHNTKALVEE
ncbi:ABC transporter ATP-binding protein [uncultured Winogradskyella sp.]|uniref:ABC transporter ATP-binding protein n=1 Tax=uncultured Winogradskyella sp. TaxID=395353 RepID=UPI003512130C